MEAALIIMILAGFGAVAWAGLYGLHHPACKPEDNTED